MRRLKPWQSGAMVALALAQTIFCGRALAAEIGVEMQSVAGLAAAPQAILIRHRYRHHRRKHFENIAPAPDGTAQAPSRDAKPEGEGLQPTPDSAKPFPKEAAKPPAQEPDRKAPAEPEPVGPPPPPEKWTSAEIEAGRKDCLRRIWDLHMLFQPLDPVREGACGAPAPVRLLGFDYGTEPVLLFSPAPMVSCKLAANLRRWADDVLQPSAKTHLHARIVTITTLSSYRCIPQFDVAGERISQHGFANAVDISEFITEKGERIAVLDNWNAKGERSAFLHAIHDGACVIFGTTLGPEANEAHKNHFHLDMKERQHPLCDFTPEQVKAREEAQKKPPAAEAPVNAPKSGAQGR